MSQVSPQKVKHGVEGPPARSVKSPSRIAGGILTELPSTITTRRPPSPTRKVRPEVTVHDGKPAHHHSTDAPRIVQSPSDSSSQRPISVKRPYGSPHLTTPVNGARSAVDHSKPGLFPAKSYTGASIKMIQPLKRAESSTDLRSISHCRNQSSDTQVFSSMETRPVARPVKLRPKSDTLSSDRPRTQSLSSDVSDTSILSRYTLPIGSPPAPDVTGNSQIVRELDRPSLPRSSSKSTIVDEEEATTLQSNRKIMDLEIRNASLLAVNTQIEKKAREQTKELVELRQLLSRVRSERRLPSMQSNKSTNEEASDIAEGNSNDLQSITDSFLDVHRDMELSIKRTMILSEVLLEEARRGLAYRPRDSEIMGLKVLVDPDISGNTSECDESFEAALVTQSS